MEIVYIDDIQEFSKLKENWRAVYSNDPRANFFVSWEWLNALFVTVHNWSVLALRQDETSPFVAFFPFVRTERRTLRLIRHRQLYLGGRPLQEYSGFLCLPSYDNIAMQIFARHIQKELRWDRFTLQDVMDSRLSSFLSHFPAKSFLVRHGEQVSCPYIPLPDTWQDYLNEGLPRKVRQDMQRAMRRIECLDEFRVEHVKADNIETQINTLLTFWQRRWGYFSDGQIKVYHKLLRRCLENNCLYLTTLWTGQTPIAARAAIIDRVKQVFYSLHHSWDKRFVHLAPGKVMNAYSIRYAINNSFEVFDFTRGNEAYKFSFGAKERFTRNIHIVRNGFGTTLRETIRGGQLLSK